MRSTDIYGQAEQHSEHARHHPIPSPLCSLPTEAQTIDQSSPKVWTSTIKKTALTATIMKVFFQHVLSFVHKRMQSTKMTLLPKKTIQEFAVNTNILMVWNFITVSIKPIRSQELCIWVSILKAIRRRSRNMSLYQQVGNDINSEKHMQQIQVIWNSKQTEHKMKKARVLRLITGPQGSFGFGQLP